MKPEIKQKWIDALRSGEYVQGNGKLNTGAFCCLGVLCDLAAKENLVKWEAELEYGWKVCIDGDTTRNYDFLTPSVIKWAELEQHTNRFGDVQVKWDPILIKDGYEGEDYDETVIEISELNDNEVSFSVIADLIESQL